jgi:hypothetical protein
MTIDEDFWAELAQIQAESLAGFPWMKALIFT